MSKTVSHLLHDYGVAKFGDYWPPSNIDQWLDGDEGATLRELIANKDAANPETAHLLNKLGESMFCDKWRPETATAILGEEGAAKVAEFLQSEAVSLQPSL